MSCWGKAIDCSDSLIDKTVVLDALPGQCCKKTSPMLVASLVATVSSILSPQPFCCQSIRALFSTDELMFCLRMSIKGRRKSHVLDESPTPALFFHRRPRFPRRFFVARPSRLPYEAAYSTRMDLWLTEDWIPSWLTEFEGIDKRSFLTSILQFRRYGQENGHEHANISTERPRPWPRIKDSRLLTTQLDETIGAGIWGWWGWAIPRLVALRCCDLAATISFSSIIIDILLHGYRQYLKTLDNLCIQAILSSWSPRHSLHEDPGRY
ncbi:hypothetical protein C8J56DRAFT_1062280 [Mycena floridula]|nr:hypothetical protein C8J56DRAFT_1062280 [Mycena floridula]